MTTTTDTKPWYKQFWPWFILALPATSVVLGISLVIVATQNSVSMVKEDWYKEGLAINARLDKQRFAQDQGITAELRYEKDNGQLLLKADNISELQSALTIRLIHPTLEDRDKQLEAARTPSGAYLARLNVIPTGFYYVQVSDLEDTWQIDGTLNFSNEQVVVQLPTR